MPELPTAYHSSLIKNAESCREGIAARKPIHLNERFREFFPATVFIAVDIPKHLEEKILSKKFEFSEDAKRAFEEFEKGLGQHECPLFTGPAEKRAVSFGYLMSKNEKEGLNSEVWFENEDYNPAVIKIDLNKLIENNIFLVNDPLYGKGGYFVVDQEGKGAGIPKEAIRETIPFKGEEIAKLTNPLVWIAPENHHSEMEKKAGELWEKVKHLF